jgi:hypothetical protein
MSADPFESPNPSNVAANPYAPTVNVTKEAGYESDAEAFRKKYISHEASVKSIGTLYLIGTAIMIPLGLASLVIPLLTTTNATGGPDIFFVLGVGAVYLAFGIGYGFVGVGIRQLRPWARIVGIVFSAIGLIGFPIGTLISLYFLYLLASEKGSVVFSDSYKQVIAQTPHIKYRTSVIVWVLVALLLIVLAMGVVGMFFAG